MRSGRPVEKVRRRPASRDGARVGERMIAIFCLGVVLFNPLVIVLFDRGAETTVLGLPLLYLYLFAAWALLIALLAWAVERSAGGQGSRPPQDGGR